MSKFNEILVGRYNRFVQKLLSMKGPATMPQVASEMQPVLPFFNGRENRYLEGWNTYAFARGTIAVAAVNGAIRLRNPAGSNVIAVLEKVAVSPANLADTLVFSEGPTAADLPTVFVVGLKRLDPRGGGDSILITSDTTAGNGSPLRAAMAIGLPSNQSIDFLVTDSHEVPLLPGEAWEVRSNTVNQAIGAITFMWRERFLEDSERT